MDTHIFDNCSALTIVTLPESLRNVKDHCFIGFSKLAKVVLSAPVPFHPNSFIGCTRMIELAEAAGFPSTIIHRENELYMVDPGVDTAEHITHTGDGVAPYLLDRFYNDEKKRIILRASREFVDLVNEADGLDEAEKVEAARLCYPAKFPTLKERTAGDFLMQTRDGVHGVLSDVLKFV